MRNRKVFILVFGMAFMLNLLGYSFLQYELSQTKTYTIEQLNSQEVPANQDVYITIVRNKDWWEGKFNHGVQYDVVLVNNSSHDISDWSVEFDIPEKSRLSDSWNISSVNNDGHITAMSLEYNTIVESQDNQTFGFITIGPKIVDIPACTLEYSPICKITDYAMFWANVILSAILVLVLVIAEIVDIKTASLRKQNLEDKNIITQTMKTFSNFIDTKDPYTQGHSNRVAIYSRELARKLKLPAREVELIYYSALLHDVGKILISDDILKKPGKLTPEEKKIIETHTTMGAEILKDFSAIEGITAGARYHHEHYDGKGYPSGLKGEDIPFLARIICVADSYDAMSSDRCYRKHLSEEQIRNELVDNSGTQFDPEVVRCMLELLDEKVFDTIEEIRDINLTQE